MLWRREACTDRSFYTEKLFTQRSLYNLVHANALTQRSLYTQKLLQREAFTQRSFYKEKLLHREAFTKRSFYTEELLHRSFYAQMLLRREAFTRRSFYTEKLLHREALTRSKLLHREAFTRSKLLHREALRPQRQQKLQLGTKAKKTISTQFLTSALNVNDQRQDWGKTAAKALQYDLRPPAAKDNIIKHTAAPARSIDAATPLWPAETELQSSIIKLRAAEIEALKPDLSAKAEKTTILKHFPKGFLKGKWSAPKRRENIGFRAIRNL